jgi:hypothetical protein
MFVIEITRARSRRPRVPSSFIVVSIIVAPPRGQRKIHLISRMKITAKIPVAIMSSPPALP